jgi:hypothetical protein
VGVYFICVSAFSVPFMILFDVIMVQYSEWLVRFIFCLVRPSWWRLLFSNIAENCQTLMLLLFASVAKAKVIIRLLLCYYYYYGHYCIL